MDQDFIPLSALQHFLYCPRQCALIHTERLWAENQQTAEGLLMHDRVDKIHSGRRRGVRTACALPIVNPALGISGVADVVEFSDGSCPNVFPVEYKRGRKKHTAQMRCNCVHKHCVLKQCWM
ncbi:CRISPR-associated protein Cas4 [Pseudoduganella danionis]|uniref:CRISPR-associated protein Cas4 n=1 Tax=Pseudoduganella danionis TaxID=1890295 RepID=UPI00360FD6D9